MTQEQAIWIAVRMCLRFEIDVRFETMQVFYVMETGRERKGDAWHISFDYNLPEDVISSNSCLFIEIEVLTGEILQRECVYCKYLGNYLADHWIQSSMPF